MFRLFITLNNKSIDEMTLSSYNYLFNSSNDFVLSFLFSSLIFNRDRKGGYYCPIKQVTLNVSSPYIINYILFQGGLGKFEKHADRAGYFGWMGYGGSAFQWHPELQIGFAYTCTLLFPVHYFKNLVLFCIS